ncbi:MAG: ATP-binding protein [Chloroflexota bacterium]|nr:ATP-binding protein [Chloroflexota bacterium]
MREKPDDPVGRVGGPGPEPHTFTFISPDPEQVLKIGVFVTYRTVAEGVERAVLARVVERQPVRLYPDSFLADPDVSPDAMAEMVGYSGTRAERFEVTGEVIGYFDPGLRDFVNPRIAPHSGNPVYLAGSALLGDLLSKCRAGETGSAEVGWLLSREPGSVPVCLDLAAIVSRHLAIIGSTGAGTSYLASVLIEEMMKPNNRAALVVVDPRGEYDALAEMGAHPALAAEGYRPDVRIYKPGEVDVEQVELRELVRPGTCAVLQLNEVNPREQQEMVAVLLRRLYDARCTTYKQEATATEKPDFYLPYPLFTLIEEAHHFAPSDADVASTSILGQILAEGWRIGVGIGLISQRPGKLDRDLLSQCHTQCLLRIVNPVDQARVAESVESVGRDLLRELPALTKGQAIIAGAAVNIPVLCRVRPRHIPHRVEDSSAPQTWLDYFAEIEQERRERETAPLSRRQGGRKRWKQ